MKTGKMKLLTIEEPTELIYKVLVWISALLAPLFGILGAMVFFIIVDFMTGIYAAIKNREKIVAHKMMNTVSKFLFYNLAVITGFVFETFIFQEIPLTKIVSSFVAITELKSIFENFNRIYGIDILHILRLWIVNKKDLTKAISEDMKSHPKSKES